MKQETSFKLFVRLPARSCIQSPLSSKALVQSRSGDSVSTSPSLKLCATRPRGGKDSCLKLPPQVQHVRLKDGDELPADFLVVGIGARPRVQLFEDQLEMEKGGFKVRFRRSWGSQSRSWGWLEAHKKAGFEAPDKSRYVATSFCLHSAL